jgi:hypothetical protein
MNAQSFKSLLAAPYWSKDVVVWAGNQKQLDDMLSGIHRADIDLLDLLPDDDDLQSAADERAELLRRALDRHLQSLRSEGDIRTVLVVRNAALLIRYRVGLGPFYDWFGGDKTMAVLVVDRQNRIGLPPTVAGTLKVNSDYLSEQFQRLLAKPDNFCSEIA